MPLRRARSPNGTPPKRKSGWPRPNGSRARRASGPKPEIRTLIEARTKAEAAAEALERKIREGKAEREQAEELLRVQFRNLANDILSEQTRHFKETNREAARPAAETFQREYRRFPHARRADLFDRTRAARRVEGRIEEPHGAQPPHHGRDDQSDQRPQREFQGAGRLGQR